MNCEKSDFDRLFFEVFERVLRFCNHIEYSCGQIARPNRRHTAQDAIARALMKRLHQYIEYLVNIFKLKQLDDSDRVRLLRKALDNLAMLHITLLSAVPRPYEPIELVSYIRQAVHSFSHNPRDASCPPHVFATEILGDQAHSRFDHPKYDRFMDSTNIKSGILNDWIGTVIEGFLNEGGNNTQTFSESDDNAFGFISLPRIDFGNPLRWPSLMHEMGHFEQDCEPKTIWKAFSRLHGGLVRSQAISFMQGHFKQLDGKSGEFEDEVRRWLIECWCDAHAARIAGAPALFSQMHAFLFSVPCYLTEAASWNGYPPAWFRLRLMRALISTRHAKEERINKMVSEEWSALERLFGPEKNADVRYNFHLNGLFNCFVEFLTQQFPDHKWHSQSKIDSSGFDLLIDDLKKGLPIPTHRNFNGVMQTRASHAEILLAGWAIRSTSYKENLLSLLHDTSELKIESALKGWQAIVDRADASLQMSIQTSEWFGIFETSLKAEVATASRKDKEFDAVNNPAACGDGAMRSAGLLPDAEIKNLILNHELRIIPLINGVDKIEGTVVDVRLGHNFEIFFTNISGALDPMNRGRRDVLDSIEVDYDSLDGLEIAPGQFVLGHTLEYVKLPPDVTAEVNGRSSFARLGIEVHKTAPFIEAGFDGCLTLEISNCGHSAVKLYPGMRIAQLRFYRCTSMPNRPYGVRLDGKYRGRLRHNKTEQFSDWEVDAFNVETGKRKGRS